MSKATDFTEAVVSKQAKGIITTSCPSCMSDMTIDANKPEQTKKCRCGKKWACTITDKDQGVVKVVREAMDYETRAALVNQLFGVRPVPAEPKKEDQDSTDEAVPEIK